MGRGERDHVYTSRMRGHFFFTVSKSLSPDIENQRIHSIKMPTFKTWGCSLNRNTQVLSAVIKFLCPTNCTLPGSAVCWNTGSEELQPPVQGSKPHNLSENMPAASQVRCSDSI